MFPQREAGAFMSAASDPYTAPTWHVQNPNTQDARRSHTRSVPATTDMTLAPKTLRCIRERHLLPGRAKECDFITVLPQNLNFCNRRHSQLTQYVATPSDHNFLHITM